MSDESRREAPGCGPGERALDALLGSPFQGAPSRTEEAQSLAREKEWLAARLERAADELRVLPGFGARQEARFVARVLARTTRQDLSWRGDLRLAYEFLRARLRASPALRLVAASLVLHIVAAPAVAYWVFHRPEPQRLPHIRFELPAETFAEPIPYPEPVGENVLLEAARRAEARENEIARSRHVLLARGPRAPVFELAAGAPLELRLLDERARMLRGESDGSTIGDEAAPLDLETLGLALWVEGALDRLVLHGAEHPALRTACVRLSSRSAAASGAPVRTATAELGRAALERAGRIGLVEVPPSAASVTALLGPEWFDAFLRAGAEHGLAETELWRAWGAWGGR